MKKLPYILLGAAILSLLILVPVRPIVGSFAYTPIPRLDYSTYLQLRNSARDSTLVRWNPKSNNLAVANANNANIVIMDIDTVTAQNTLMVSPDSANQVAIRELVWSPNGEYLAAAFGSTGIYPQSITIGQPSATNDKPVIINNSDRIYSLSWSADSSKLAVAEHNQVAIYDAHSGNQLDKLHGDTNGIDTIAWSPNGKSIASVSPNGKIQVWDGQTYRLRFNLSKPTWFLEPAEVIVWDPASELLIGADCNVSLGGCGFWEWNIATGRVLSPFKEDKDAVGQPDESRPYSLIWQPNGMLLFAVTDDSAIWDVATGERVASFGRVLSASWSSDGKKLATVDEDGSVTIGAIN